MKHFLPTVVIAVTAACLLGLPTMSTAQDCGHPEDDADYSAAILWRGPGPTLSLAEIVGLSAPILWYSKDEPLIRMRDFPFPHPHPCDTPSDSSVVYYQVNKIELRGDDEVTMPPRDDLNFFEKVKTFSIRYYFYYHEDVGMNGHIHDLEVAEFEINLEVLESGCYQVRLTRVTAFAHGTDWYSNELLVPDDIAIPPVLFVEEGKHATCPDRNGDGLYTPGYDVNVRINDAWGIRDVFGSGWLITPAYQGFMFKPRRPEYRVLPPDSPNAYERNPYITSLLPTDSERSRYELRPAQAVVMCDSVAPSRDFLISMMDDHHFGNAYEPKQFKGGSIKALADPLKGESKWPSINLRWDRGLGLSLAFGGIPIESRYLVPRITWIPHTSADDEISFEGLVSASASQFMGTYISLGGAWEQDWYTGPTGDTVKSPENEWNFVTEVGIKFRFRLKGKIRLFVIGHEFGGIRFGVRWSGFDNLKNFRAIAEVGAGVW